MLKNYKKLACLGTEYSTACIMQYTHSSPLGKNFVKDKIESKYDDELEAYLVSFPERISYEALSKWGIEFQKILDSGEHQKPVALLLDTNKHDFESIECLKLLREILTQFSKMNKGIYKIAFVRPVDYGKPGVVDLNEAYFSSVEKAKSWLKG